MSDAGVDAVGGRFGRRVGARELVRVAYGDPDRADLLAQAVGPDDENIFRLRAAAL